MPKIRPSTYRAMTAFFPLLLTLGVFFVGRSATAASKLVLRLDGDSDYVQLPSHIFDDLEQATIEAWRQWQPHLIWMDMRMPVLDGYEATRWIKSSHANPEGEQTKIIALTASAFEENRQQVLDAGCDDFVRKPFREEELFAKIAEYLGVVYRYAEEEESAGSVPVELSAADLAVLPEAWRRSVAHAASTADENALLALIEEIAPERAALAEGLRERVHNFAFEELMHLTQ